ncbi:MAG: hypothetical protein FJW40_02290 [Acidobacteria bacterium]|nr:hypothetical protein [Acidobacteriota bacterium]
MARPTRTIPLLLFSSLVVRAQPVDVLAAPAFSCFTRLEGAPRVSLATIDVEGPGFTRAWRLTTRELAPNAWDLRLRCFATRPARQGDLGVATFWLRSTRDTNAATQFVVEQGAPPYSKSLNAAVSTGREWRRFQIPFRWDATYDGSTSGPASYNLSFWVNVQLQELEIGGFELLNHGPDVDPASLGLEGYPYPGAGPDAAWRAAAAERIEKIRKAPVEITVRNSAGQPVPGANLRVRMKRHAFGFATAIDCGTLLGTGADSQRYRDELLRNFNKVAIENDLKWPFFETWAAGRFEAASTWLRENGFNDVHAHVMVWPGARNLPADVQTMLRANPVDKDALRLRVNGHIERIGRLTSGRVTEWDVINEPYDNKDLMAALGDAEMAEWFKRARRIDPSFRLFLNDYGNVEGGGFNMAHMNATLRALRIIQENGGPVDGVGLQGHFSGQPTDLERVWELFELFARDVETIQITEFDVSNVDPDVRARYTRDFLTLAFSHPKMNGFTLWGFWAGRHWRPEAAMFARDWTPTPALEAWRDLIYREWWTDVEGATGEDGVLRFRGFFGQYEAESGATKRTLTVEPGKENRLELVLEP